MWTKIKLGSVHKIAFEMKKSRNSLNSNKLAQPSNIVRIYLANLVFSCKQFCSTLFQCEDIVKCSQAEITKQNLNIFQEKKFFFGYSSPYLFLKPCLTD